MDVIKDNNNLTAQEVRDRLTRAARDLYNCAPGNVSDNPEYLRGMVELIAYGVSCYDDTEDRDDALIAIEADILCECRRCYDCN